MNFNDTEIAWSILKDKGYAKAESINEVWFLNFIPCKFILEINIILLTLYEISGLIFRLAL